MTVLDNLSHVGVLCMTGGCTLSIAVGMAVLDELDAGPDGHGQLWARAAMVGQDLMANVEVMQQVRQS
jgi:4-aminobutyrate aminotransferase-like enzyme